MAKVPFLKPAFHSLEKDFSLAEIPASTMLTDGVPGLLDGRVALDDEVSSVSK